MTALECWRRGCNVRIMERAPACSTVGKVLVEKDTNATTHMIISRRFFPDRAQRVSKGDISCKAPLTIAGSIGSFKHYPFMQEKAREIQFHTMVAIHNQRGEQLQAPAHFESFMSKSTSPQARANMQRHSRPLFHAMLSEQLAQVGIDVEYSMEVTKYFEDVSKGRAGVVTKDGSTYEADLVVAADGVRGNSWPLVAGEPVPAQSSGDAIFRVAYPVELALADPMIAERFKLREDGESALIFS